MRRCIYLSITTRRPDDCYVAIQEPPLPVACVSCIISAVKYIADQIHVPKITPKVEHSKNEHSKTSYHSHDSNKLYGNI